MRLTQLLVFLIAGFLLAIVSTGYCGAQPPQAIASSEWGPGYGAAAAADEVAGENGNYWQTVQGKDKGAWWQLDLGRETTIPEVKITWARWENQVHCPPADMAIQVSLVGKADSWRTVRTLGPSALPRAGEPFTTERVWRYTLPQPTRARYLRLLFPSGSQPGAKYPGYLCLGEVEVPVPQIPAKLIALEGGFGKAEINVEAPAVVSLLLRAKKDFDPFSPPTLGPQSLLARRGAIAYPGYSRGRGRLPWAREGCTYVVAQDGTRFESRQQQPEKVEVNRTPGRSVLKLSGIKISGGMATAPVALEDWTLSTSDDSSLLIWKISRTWKKDLKVVMSGSPGLFFAFDSRRLNNSVTSTLWYDPRFLTARSSEIYNLAVSFPGRIAENHVQTILDRDSWAVYKLWTNWQAPADLRLEVEGGHLYRRGSFAFLSEAGAVTTSEPVFTRRAGQAEQITLKIAGVDKRTTGYQLAIVLPDKAMEEALVDFYGSVLNGGAINDQKNYDFGNETDGWYYAGSSWMYGAALAAGTPAAGPLSSRPYDAARAFRGHLARIMATLDKEGRTHFGYNQTGQWVDDNLHTILGVHFYVLHSGDLAFVRDSLPAMEKMLAYFIRRRGPSGLFQLEGEGAHWYYDCIRTSGVNGYYNAFFYKAACDLAEMEEAAGFPDKARAYRSLAESLKKAFHVLLWRENLPGGPRYLDWIDSQGHPIAYFCDLCQWPPIAVGIATPEQARKIVATADARIKELEKQFNYQGYASLSALWPVPDRVNGAPWQTFGTYMNGGSLLCQTYWEVMARARAGDHDGAARRLRSFARRARETSWVGNNSADIHGNLNRTESGEPYLADMVAATAAVVHGILGITPTWPRLEVVPHLPGDWPSAEAEVLYKGQRHRVKIDGKQVQVRKS